MKALVIDDSRAIRKILTRHLRDLGFNEISEAGDGREALSQLAETIDLVLVDWNMPIMNGVEFLAAMRARPAYDDVKVMMVTTETELERVLLALESGANEYVMKPFTKDVLREKLDILGLGV